MNEWKEQKQPPEVFDKRRCSSKFHKIQRKTPVTVSFLLKFQASGLQLYLKETLAQVFFCEFSEISKNTFFIKTFGRLLLKGKIGVKCVNVLRIHGTIRLFKFIIRVKFESLLKLNKKGLERRLRYPF